MKKLYILKYGFLFFLFACAATLSLEIWMQVSEKGSLCTTSACKLVSGYVRFGEIYLIVAGAVFFWLLTLVTFFVLRYDKKWLAAIGSVLLFGALSFDGALLGYQYIGLGQKCALCFAVGAVLLFSLLGWSCLRKSLIVAIIGIGVWTGGFAANSILEVRTKTPDLDQTAFLQKKSDQEYAAVKLYLFFSLHCGHCSKLMANLAVNKPWGVTWNICSFDTRKKDLNKLAHMLAHEDVQKRPFETILKLEQKKDLEPLEIPDKLRKSVENARTYFRNSGFQGVPLLIADVGVGRRIINVGSQNILDYLTQVGLVKERIDFDKLKQELKKSKHTEDGGKDSTK